jgi:hypothetical protein
MDFGFEGFRSLWVCWVFFFFFFFGIVWLFLCILERLTLSFFFVNKILLFIKKKNLIEDTAL